MWPKLTNIHPNIVENLSGPTSVKRDLAASQRVAWIRVFSGAVQHYRKPSLDKQGNPILDKDGKVQKEEKQSGGLVLQSNNAFELFRAAGQTNGSIYGDRNSTGDIGFDWELKAVPSPTQFGVLRPSPIITGLEIKEGIDQISRECTLRLKCFTLGQMEQIQTYFLEPGYSLCIEFGWNTPLAGMQMIDINGKTKGILADATTKNLNPTLLDKARIDSKGDYDTFLGFIVGGSCTTEGDKWNVEVKLRGAPGLPTFLQTQQKTLEWSQTDKKPVPGDPPETYNPDDLTINTDAIDVVLARRWKNMYNQLPATRQTAAVRKIYDDGKVDANDFINMDALINHSVTEYTSPGWVSQALYAVGSFFGSEKLGSSTTFKVGDVTVEKSKLFSTNKYISMGLAIKILNENSEFSAFNLGSKKVSVRFDIDECVIGAFPHMFSTKATKLAIPNNVPDFSQYFLKTDSVTQSPDGKLNGADTVDCIPAGHNAFSQSGPLDKYGLKEIAGYWGYLKDLYINFDMFIEKLQIPNKNIREVFLDMLNEMSTAACGFWNFQISEQKSSDGNSIIITVHDENWIGSAPQKPETFYHSGPLSVFLEANLNIALPSEMTSQIVSTRLSLANNPNQPPITIGGFFSSATDLFLESVTKDNKPAKLTPEEQKKADEEKAARQKEEDEKDEDKVKAKLDALDKELDLRSDSDALNGFSWYDHATGKKLADNDPRPDEYRRLNDLYKKLKGTKAANAQAQAAKTLTGNLAKIDVVVKPGIAQINVGNVDMATFKQFYDVYCFNDTAYFDLLKRTFYERGNGTLSHPIPIRYTFKVLGTSGIRRGDTFNIIGIPEKYTNNGLFQVEQVEHNLDGNLWTTQVTGIYRTEQKGVDVKPAEPAKKSKIICNELYNQGFLPKHIWEADEKWGDMMYKKDRRMILGYMMWAKDVVSYMKANPQNTKWIYMILKPWTEHMAYEMGTLPKDNFIGKLIHFVGKQYSYYVYDKEMSKRKKFKLI